MQKKLIPLALLGALIATEVANTAAIAQGLPIMARGLDMKNPAHDFSRRLGLSMHVKGYEVGMAPIPGASGGFTSARDVYETLRRQHPELGFTKVNPDSKDLWAMIEYVDTLELKPLGKLAGNYYNTRVVGTGADRHIDFDWTAVLSAETLVLVDRNTGEPIFKRNCGNGLKRIVACVLVDIEATHVKAAGLLWGVYRDDGCLGARFIAKAGEPEPANAHYDRPTEGGCGGDCTLKHADKIVGESRVATGLLAFRGPHVVRFRVRPGQILADCILTPGAQRPSSFSNIVWWKHHYVPFGGTSLATVHAVPRNDSDARNPMYLVSWGRGEQVGMIYGRPLLKLTLTDDNGNGSGQPTGLR